MLVKLYRLFEDPLGMFPMPYEPHVNRIVYSFEKVDL